jgi:hypothetical protein
MYCYCTLAETVSEVLPVLALAIIEVVSHLGSFRNDAKYLAKAAIYCVLSKGAYWRYARFALYSNHDFLEDQAAYMLLNAKV